MDERLRMLLIYEHAESRTQILDLLGQTDLSGFELECLPVHTATGGCFSDVSYDVCVVVADVEKVKLMSKLRLLGLRAPIIVLTGDSGSEILEAIHHGATDCLIQSKLTAATLEESVCAAIEKSRTLELQANWARYYLGLIENSSDVIYTQDLQGNFTSINKVGERLFGYTRDEIVGMNFRDIVEADYVDLVQQSVIEMLEYRQPGSQEVLVVAKQGERVLFRVTHHLIYRDGAPIAIQGLGRDPGWSLPYRPAFPKEREART